MRISKLTAIVVLVAFLLMAGTILWNNSVVILLDDALEKQKTVIETQDKMLRAALRQMTEMQQLLNQQGPY